MFGSIIGGITGAASLIMGYKANEDAKEAAKAQKMEYERQIQINKEITQFNNEVVDFTSKLQIKEVRKETEKGIKEQVHILRNRGIELSGSPMFILGDTKSMGDAKVQEILFNTEVQKRNNTLNAEAGNAVARAGIAQSEMSMKEATYNQWSLLFKGLKAGIGAVNNIMGKELASKISPTGAGISPTGGNYIPLNRLYEAKLSV